MNTIIAWLGFLIAVAALILGWVAFNRTGTDVEALVKQQTEAAAADLREEWLQFQSRFQAEQEEGTADEAATSTDEAEETDAQ